MSLCSEDMDRTFEPRHLRGEKKSFNDSLFGLEYVLLETLETQNHGLGSLGRTVAGAIQLYRN